jgi:hypothetical protein
MKISACIEKDMAVVLQYKIRDEKHLKNSFEKGYFCDSTKRHSFEVLNCHEK